MSGLTPRPFCSRRSPGGDPLLPLGRVRLGFDFGLIKRWLPLALPFAFTFFLTNLYFRADVPILQHFRPFAEVGWYQLAYKPFEALQFVPLAIQAVVYPLLGVYFVSDPARLRLAYQRFFKVLVLLGWPLTVGTFVLVHQIAPRLSLFDQSEPSLRILAFAIVFLFANSAFYAMLNATNRQGRNAWARVWRAQKFALTFFFLFWLTPGADVFFLQKAFGWFVGWPRAPGECAVPAGAGGVIILAGLGCCCFVCWGVLFPP